MSLQARIEYCRTWDRQDYRPFTIMGRRYGRVTHAFSSLLERFPEVFQVEAGSVALNPSLDRYDERSRAVERAMAQLAEDGHIVGWRNEVYPVLRHWGDKPVMEIERAAVPKLGLHAFGIHVNGFVRRPEGLMLWVGKRSAHKQTAPGKFDHLVAGGQPINLSLKENVIKEGAEEAGLPRSLTERAVPVGAVSYLCERPEGLRDDLLFCYDLELPADFTPASVDGEVETFSLWPVAEVLETIRQSDSFKFNVALVNLDFLIRHGVLTPEDPEYLCVFEGLRLVREAG